MLLFIVLALLINHLYMFFQKQLQSIVFLKFLIFILVSHINAIGQEINKTYTIGEVTVSSKQEIEPDLFHENIIGEIIFDQINYLLEKRGFDGKQKNEILIQAANDQATYMAFVESAKLIRDENVKTETLDRLRAYGGSGFGKELVSKSSISSGKIPYTYAKVANDIAFKWFTSSKTVKMFESSQFNLIGIAVKLDEKGRKIYISVILGNFKSFNDGPKYLSNLKVPYSTKTYGLKQQNKAFCKKVNKYENLMDLQKGLIVEDNIIYFESDNIRSIQKLIGSKKDGFAVDILQKEQFECENPNIVDYNRINQGVLTKRIYSKKIFKKNIVDEEIPNGLKVELAIIPENITNDYELNLVVIKNKSVCKTIPKSFIIKPSGKYERDVVLIADTVTINSRFQYKPTADSIELSMRIPFENKKYTYKSQDIEEFINLLNEPKFLIYDLKITAYSSIEGTDIENRKLQQKRAESITKALKNRQADITNTKIIPAYNWDDFKKDINGTRYKVLDSMNIEEAQQYIKKNNLNKELESILKNHRYAQIDMKIFYDIVGENEQPFVIKNFNDALIIEDRITALSIEKFIMKQVLNYRYKPDILNKLEIPNAEIYAGLIMNKLWLQHYTKQISTNEFLVKVDSLSLLSPDNEYITFNNLLLQITEVPFTNTNRASQLQTQVDKLYYTPLSKRIIDGLNIKLQFKQLDFLDTIANNQKLKKVCIKKIKEIVDLNDETMQNSLKLAELFMEINDYEYAIKTLEHWVTHPNTTEKLLLSYVSLCSQYEMTMHTQKFNYAMTRIRELNPQQFCDLLNGNSFSLKVFENNFIKDEYCKYCKDDLSQIN